MKRKPTPPTTANSAGEELKTLLEQPLCQKAASRRDEVYTHLLGQMNAGRLLPGSIVNMNNLCEELDISRTPLREALIRLDAEGAVTIHPRSHIVVNSLTLEEFRQLYDLIGAIEASLISNSFANYTPQVLEVMKQYNAAMEAALHDDDILLFEKLHYKFHHVFLAVSRNTYAERILIPMKNRMWDYPKRSFHKAWYFASVNEHYEIIAIMEQGDREKAASFMRDTHWGFAFNEPSIRKTYFG